MRTVRKLRLSAIILAGVVVSTSCNDVTLPAVSAPTAHSSTGSGDIHEIFRILPRVDVRLALQGPFKPGQPIRVTATARANRSATQASVRLFVLDDGTEDSKSGGRMVNAWNGSLSEGAVSNVDASVRFAKAGYYKILARADGAGNDNARIRLADDPQITSGTYAMSWVRVDENGGGVTEEYDASSARSPGRKLAFGSSGPFLSEQVAVRPEASTAANDGEVRASDRLRGAVAALSSCSTFGVYCGSIRYAALDKSGALKPVANIE